MILAFAFTYVVASLLLCLPLLAVLALIILLDGWRVAAVVCLLILLAVGCAWGIYRLALT